MSQTTFWILLDQLKLDRFCGLWCHLFQRVSALAPWACGVWKASWQAVDDRALSKGMLCNWKIYQSRLNWTLSEMIHHDPMILMEPNPIYFNASRGDCAAPGWAILEPFFYVFFFESTKYVFLMVFACIDESRSTMQETPTPSTPSSPRSLAASRSREAAASWGLQVPTELSQKWRDVMLRPPDILAPTLIASKLPLASQIRNILQMWKSFELYLRVIFEWYLDVSWSSSAHQFAIKVISEHLVWLAISYSKNPACSIPSAGAVASQNIHKQTLFPNSDAPRIFTSLINLGLTTPVAKSLNTACLSLSSGKMWNMWKVYEREKQKSAMHRDAKNDRESVTTCHNMQGICFQLMGQSSLFRTLSTYLAVLSSWRPGAWRLKISMVFTKWAQPSAHTFLKTTERQTPCLKEARSANWALWEGSVLSTNNSKTFHTYSRRKMKFRIANKAKNYQKLSGL